MLGTNDRTDAGIRRFGLRGFLHVGVAVSALTLFVLMPGCAAGGGGGGGGAAAQCDPACGEGFNCVDGECVCENDAACDDDDLCTTDACTEGACVNTPVACEAGFECDAETGECVAIPDLCADVVCEAGFECDPETGECVEIDLCEGVECADGEVCDPATGECVAVECTEETAAVDCDDADLCTTDTCVDSLCVNEAVVCGEDEECDPETGECVPIVVDLCEGVECDPGFECDPATGECVAVGEQTDLAGDNPDVEFGALTAGTGVALVAPEAITPRAAADEDLCDCAWSVDGDGTFDPADACATTYTPAANDTQVTVTVVCTVDGEEFEDTFGQDVAATGCTLDSECDDTLFCNGSETCEANACVAGTSPCAEGQECFEETDTCGCTTDEDCDDGLFCNGTETCDTVASTCVEGTDPCADTECECGEVTCVELDTDADCVCPDCETIDFTLNQDDLDGTAGDDTFSAPLIFAEGAGAQRDSLQTGDAANGQAGTDDLFATLTQGAAPVVTLIGIENLYFTNYAAEVINASNISGAALIGWVSSTANLTVNTLPNKVNALIEGIKTAALTFQLSFQAGASTSPTTAATDAITVEVTDTTTGTFQVVTAANGFEILNVDSTGGNANTLTAITQTTGTTMATANFTGDTDLTVNTIPNTILTIVGTSMSGGLQLGTGTTAATYAAGGFASAVNNLTDMDTGTGNDTIIFGTQLNTNDFTTATVDLNTGTDIVEAIFAADYGTAMPFRNVEEFRFNCTTAATVNMTSITGLTTVTDDADGFATAITLQNLPATAGLFPTLNFRGDNTQAAQTYDTITYAATGNTGAADTLNVNVANRGTALNAGTATTNVHTVGPLTAAGFENMNIDVADGPLTITTGVTASTLINLDVDASSNATLGTVTTGGTGITVLNVDASGVLGNFSATIDYVASGAAMTLGGGNDVLTIGVNSTAATLFVTLGAGNDTFTGDTNTDCADTVTAGAGADTIQAGDGNDTITTGDGSDTVIFDQATALDREDIADFTAGAGGDVMKFDISDLALAAAGAEATGVVAVAEFTNLAAGTDIYILTASGYATDAAAETALAGDADAAGPTVFIYFNTGDSTTHILYDPIAETDTPSAVLIGKLTNIITQGAHDLLTVANIDSQA